MCASLGFHAKEEIEMDVPPGFQDKEEASQVHMEEYVDASKLYNAPLLQAEQAVPTITENDSQMVRGMLKMPRECFFLHES
jgi:hypothetical protein